MSAGSSFMYSAHRQRSAFLHTETSTEFLITFHPAEAKYLRPLQPDRNMPAQLYPDH